MDLLNQENDSPCMVLAKRRGASGENYLGVESLQLADNMVSVIGVNELLKVTWRRHTWMYFMVFNKDTTLNSGIMLSFLT